MDEETSRQGVLIKQCMDATTFHVSLVLLEFGVCVRFLERFKGEEHTSVDRLPSQSIIALAYKAPLTMIHRDSSRLHVKTTCCY